MQPCSRSSCMLSVGGGHTNSTHYASRGLLRAQKQRRFYNSNIASSTSRRALATSKPTWENLSQYSFHHILKKFPQDRLALKVLNKHCTPAVYQQTRLTFSHLKTRLRATSHHFSFRKGDKSSFICLGTCSQLQVIRISNTNIQCSLYCALAMLCSCNSTRSLRLNFWI